MFHWESLFCSAYVLPRYLVISFIGEPMLFIFFNEVSSVFAFHDGLMYVLLVVGGNESVIDC